ncbi:phage portal protein [Dyadobacter sp. Leaf189]|uniref:phage portal protein n=1 Tax=Dyadobacter sp. Leaf189 TaxID=1736295 RepID=UPI0021013D0A|nr:phage portal protein [Dyadobacter sp. Leaf189]
MSARTAMGISTFFGCVRLISNLTASTPYAVYKELEGGGSKRAKTHPLDYLLTVRSNDQMAPIIAMRTMVLNCIVHGFSIARIDKNGRNQPVSYFPYPSQNVGILEDPKSGRVFFQVVDNGDLKYFAEDEVIYLKDLSFNGIKGGSVIKWQDATVKLDLLTGSFVQRYYEKGTFIGGFLETPIPANDAESAKITKERVVESLEGSKNGGFGFAVLGPGIKWHPVSRTPVESELIKIFDKSDRDIAKVFGVPLSLIGDTEKTTSWGTGVEQMFIGLTRSVIIPIATQIEQEINYKCFRRDELQAGFYTKFNFRALLRGDSKAYGEFVARMIQIGVYSPDEVRALDEMSPIPGGWGAKHYMQGAMVPMDKLGEFHINKKPDNDTGETISASDDGGSSSDH